MAPASATKWKKVEERKQKKKSMARPYATTPTTSSSSSSELTKCCDNEEDVCSTPKGKRFRIPEVLTCPPAPKKRRVAITCSSKRSPIAFFASPDIELFFFSAIKTVPPPSGKKV
ncbi:Cyclin-dependent protein kinase inhibitor SMR13, partial [Mucuna pruriens]